MAARRAKRKPDVDGLGVVGTADPLAALISESEKRLQLAKTQTTVTLEGHRSGFETRSLRHAGNDLSGNARFAELLSALENHQSKIHLMDPEDPNIRWELALYGSVRTMLREILFTRNAAVKSGYVDRVHQWFQGKVRQLSNRFNRPLKRALSQKTAPAPEPLAEADSEEPAVVLSKEEAEAGVLAALRASGELAELTELAERPSTPLLLDGAGDATANDEAAISDIKDPASALAAFSEGALNSRQTIKAWNRSRPASAVIGRRPLLESVRRPVSASGFLAGPRPASAAEIRAATPEPVVLLAKPEVDPVSATAGLFERQVSLVDMPKPDPGASFDPDNPKAELAKYRPRKLARKSPTSETEPPAPRPAVTVDAPPTVDPSPQADQGAIPPTLNESPLSPQEAAESAFTCYVPETTTELEMDREWRKRRERDTRSEEFSAQFQDAIDSWTLQTARLEEELWRRSVVDRMGPSVAGAPQDIGTAARAARPSSAGAVSRYLAHRATNPPAEAEFAYEIPTGGQNAHWTSPPGSVGLAGLLDYPRPVAASPSATSPQPTVYTDEYVPRPGSSAAAAVPSKFVRAGCTCLKCRKARAALLQDEEAEATPGSPESSDAPPFLVTPGLESISAFHAVHVHPEEAGTQNLANGTKLPLGLSDGDSRLVPGFSHPHPSTRPLFVEDLDEEEAKAAGPLTPGQAVVTPAPARILQMEEVSKIAKALQAAAAAPVSRKVLESALLLPQDRSHSSCMSALPRPGSALLSRALVAPEKPKKRARPRTSRPVRRPATAAGRNRAP